MYGPDPNVRDVQAGFEEWAREHPDAPPSVHTQYFRLWLNRVRADVDATDHVRPKSAVQRAEREQQLAHTQADGRGSGWTWAGPDVHYVDDGSQLEVAEHSNVYTIDRSLSDPDVLYCGTESSGAYKSTDHGLHWSYVTKDLLIGAVSALRVHPTDPQRVLMSAENDLWRTTDGGVTWQVLGDAAFQAQNISAWEFAFDPSDPNTVLAACNTGLFRSTDGGDNWTSVLDTQCGTVVFNAADPAVVYTIKYEAALHYCRFYKSTDHGLTWQLRDAGWYTPPAGETGLYELEAGRLAVTAADPQRIYAVLVGYQQTGASVELNGWVGTWVSQDGGETWSNPHGLIGAPYDPNTHPNLMNFDADDGTYSQIYYNTTIIASQVDPDQVLIGGLNLWRSDDACASYQFVGGYHGPVQRTHPDMQELRVYADGQGGEEVWIGCDGGVYHSTDFVHTHESRCRGLEAVNLWGYDQGWNDDIRVGGRYHNGDMGFAEGFAEGEYLALGGGEAATGYVNYSDERKAYFSDIGGKVMPEGVTEAPENFPLSLGPNESYGFCSSSRIMFDHRWYNVAWMGRDNTLYRSTNGGSSFNVFHSFGGNANNRLLWIDQCYGDPRVMVVQQALGAASRLWRTDDDGTTWHQLTLPSSSRNMFFAVGSTNSDEMWVAYTDLGNGLKVYHSTNAGVNWTNITTPMLDGERVWGICHAYGTNGGVYLALLNGRVLYRNNDMSDWVEYSEALPAGTQPLRIVPFYRENRIRLACWNVGVWERELYEPSALTAGFAAAFGTFFCPGDSMHFVDHSVCGTNATYQWTFPGATPSTSSERYPTVVYSAPGEYDVTLTVTENGQSATITRTAFISEVPGTAPPVVEDFEGGGFPNDWVFHGSNGSASAWATRDDAGGFGLSTHAMAYDNYDIDLQGGRDEVWLGKLDLTQTTDPLLHFDVSYAAYGGQYSDTLAVLASTDCGATWQELYVKGGEELATAPDDQDFFIPTADQWRVDTVHLAAIAGANDVVIAFQDRGHFGNIIRVDNINIANSAIDGVPALTAPDGLSVFPNPAQDMLHVARANGASPILLYVLDALGRTVRQQRMVGAACTIPLEGLAAGEYVLRVGERTERFVVAPR